MNQTTTACLIIIGNEILSGRTHDKNIAYIAEKLNAIGVRLMEVRVIPDVESTIITTLNACRVAFDYIFTTGGIGPTHDDITSASVAKAFGVALHRHPEAERVLRAHYAADVMNDARLKMADVPEGATLVLNPVSTAPGFQMGNVFVMAGVPRIMQAMLDHILPQLKGGAPMRSLSITTNLPEGTIAEGLTAIQDAHPEVEIGSYPNFHAGERSTTLVCRATDAARNASAHQAIERLIQGLGGAIIAQPIS